MIKYDMFYKGFIVRRISDFVKHKNIDSITELPVGSILHILDNIGNSNPDIIPSIPSSSNTFFNLKPAKKEILFQTNFITSPIEPKLDKIKLLNIGLAKDFTKFRSDNKGKIRFLNSVEEFSNASTIGNVISYNSMFRARMLGKLGTFRKFNVILTSVLNNIEKSLSRDHFIHLPLGGLTFGRADFTRAYKEQVQTTLKFANNYQYLFLLNLLSFINEESDVGIFDRLSTDALIKTNIVIEHKGKFIIYNLNTLKELGNTNQVMINVLAQYNGLNSVKEPIRETVEIIKIPKTSSSKMNITKFSGNDEKLNAKGNESFKKEKEIVTEALIENSSELTNKQKKRVKLLVEKTKEIEFEGETVDTILNKKVDNSINTEVLDFLEDQIPDKSMLESSLRNTRTSYMKNNYKKDMVAVLTSFSSVGMYLTNLKSNDVIDNQNRLTEYVASFEDINGKKHTIKYTIPIVDKNGNVFINGSKKSLRIQRVNIPIVKVSPSRVSLSSNQNKTLVERSSAMAHSFLPHVDKILAKADDNSYSFDFGINDYKHLTLAYDYTKLGEKMISLTIDNITWNFEYDKRPIHESLENKYGTFMGGNNKEMHFISTDGILSILDENEKLIETTTVLSVLVDKLDVEIKSLSEWIDFKILDSKIPMIIVLSYKFGLSHMLKYLNASYALYERNERIKTKQSDIVIRFADRKLIIDGRDKLISLIFGGLSHYKMDVIYYEDMDGRDAYFELFEQKRLSVNYLKGIDTFFKLFMDPITADILASMGEPTNTKDLLIRASSLLVTTEHMPASSSANFRFRTYERFNDVIYNTLSRSLSTYQNGSMGASKKFSVSSYEILQAITNDPLMENINVVNPVNELKDLSGYSHIGDGGRTSEAFVLDDRQYPEDGIGIISEATVDSGKVAIDAQLSMNPNIQNTRGMTLTKDIDDISPTELLSSTSLLVPGATNDDCNNVLNTITQSH